MFHFDEEASIHNECVAGTLRHCDPRLREIERLNVWKTTKLKTLLSCCKFALWSLK